MIAKVARKGMDKGSGVSYLGEEGCFSCAHWSR